MVRLGMGSRESWCRNGRMDLVVLILVGEEQKPGPLSILFSFI